MISLKINNLKDFTSKLFVGDTFVDWLLVEATIHTHSRFQISGELNPQFFSAEELEEESMEQYNSWKLLRPICFEIIRGKHLPTAFKFIFRLPSTIVSELLQANSDYKPDDISGMDINIRYDNGSLTITTGLSLRIFTLDKSLEKSLEQYLVSFLEQQNVDYTIL